MTTYCTDDWPTTVATFRNLDLPRGRKPAGVKGHNFMTPDVLGYVRSASGADVEVSTGSGFTPGTRVFGLTFGGSADERSTCVHNWDEVLQVLADN